MTLIVFRAMSATLVFLYYDINIEEHNYVGEDDDDVDHVDHLEQKTVEEEEGGEGRHRQPASCIINY